QVLEDVGHDDETARLRRLAVVVQLCRAYVQAPIACAGGRPGRRLHADRLPAPRAGGDEERTRPAADVTDAPWAYQALDLDQGSVGGAHLPLLLPERHRIFGS